MEDNDTRVFKEQATLQIRDVLEDRATGRPYAIARIISAGMSKNQTLYPADVLAAGAHKYSKVKMMLDHPDFWGKGYTVRDLAGIYGEAHWDRAEQGVVAPLYFLTGTEAGQLALNLAREEVALRQAGILSDDDRVFGISHVAYVNGLYRQPGEDGHDPQYGYSYYEATEIEEVLSGDMVVFDAANGKVQQLFENALHSLSRRGGYPAGAKDATPPEAREGVVRRESSRHGIRKVTVKVNP